MDHVAPLNSRKVIGRMRWVAALASVFLFIGLNFAQQTLPGEVRIKWDKQEGVSRYRIQIAGDERFSDVFFDGKVTGQEYVTKDLAPGTYYWRVAPADYQTRAFLKPVRFEVGNARKPAGDRLPIRGYCECETSRKQGPSGR